MHQGVFNQIEDHRSKSGGVSGGGRCIFSIVVD